MYNAGAFPLADANNLLAAFMDGSNKAIVEDTVIGGDEGSYPMKYKETEIDCKGYECEGKESVPPREAGVDW